MRSLRRSDGRFPRFHAVDEVFLVIVRAVKFDLIAVSGDFTEPIDAGRVKGAAIDPNPTLGSYPLGAALDVTVPASDNYGDVIGILARDPVLAARIPNRVFGREVTNRFNLHG